MVGNDKFGDVVKCFVDFVFSKNLDGIDVEIIFDGFIKLWCDSIVGGFVYIFVNQVGCFIYGYYEVNGDFVKENEEGVIVVCNVIFVVVCMFFVNVVLVIYEGRLSECVDFLGFIFCFFVGFDK